MPSDNYLKHNAGNYGKKTFIQKQKFQAFTFNINKTNKKGHRLIKSIKFLKRKRMLLYLLLILVVRKNCEIHFIEIIILFEIQTILE